MKKILEIQNFLATRLVRLVLAGLMRCELLRTWLALLCTVALDTALAQAAVQAGQAALCTHVIIGRNRKLFLGVL
jgi:hypothetical protein